MWGIFNNLERQIAGSLGKYSKDLENDINLKMHVKRNSKWYATSVEYVKGKEVLFKCPTDSIDIIRFAINGTVEISLYGETGLYKTKLLITDKIIKENVLYYKGKINSKIDKLQRRENYRLPIVLGLSYTLLPNEMQMFEGHTLNLSAGGILMESDENIYLNKYIRIKININGKKYDIKSTILSKKRNFDNNTYLYHIKFDNLNKKDRNEISRFIHDKR